MSAEFDHTTALELNRCFAGLHLDSKQNLSFGPHSIMPSSNGSQGHPDLETILTRLFYEQCYCRSFQGTIITSAQDGVDLIATLSKANKTKGGWWPGWSVRSILPNGEIIAGSYNRSQKAAAGYYAASDGRIPVGIGSQVSLLRPREAVLHSGAFYMAFGETIDAIESSWHITRIYLNCKPESLPQWVATLTGLLNRYAFAFRLKVAGHTSNSERRDTAVLYFERQAYQTVLELVKEAYLVVRSGIRNDVPLFSKQLAPGLSVADNPVGEVSFGFSRCKLMAQAVLQVQERGQISPRLCIEALAQRFLATGLKPRKPYLNPGLGDVYELSTS